MGTGNGTKSLFIQWRDICNEYAKQFAEKHDIDIQYELDHGLLWIGNDPGTICEMADMFIGMTEIRYDIDNNIPEEKFSEWYWKHLDHHEMGLTYPNYESYCKGCPEPYTAEQLEKLKESQKRVAEAKQDLENCIKELGGKPGDNLTLAIS